MKDVFTTAPIYYVLKRLVHLFNIRDNLEFMTRYPYLN